MEGHGSCGMPSFCFKGDVVADNLKWFKVWTCITDDPDFLEMKLENIARWVLLGAYIRKHGNNGTIEVSNAVLAHILRAEPVTVDVTIDSLHNVIKKVNPCNDKNIVTFKNWYKYQIDDSSQRVAKYRQNVTMQDKIRLDKIKIREDKDKTDTKKKKLMSSRTPMSDENFIIALKNNAAYKGIDIDTELHKMDAWFLTPNGRGRKKTHKFILNWLNKAERKLEVNENGDGRLERLRARIAKTGSSV